MKQKMKIRRKNKMTPKKAFTIVGVSLLALVAAAGTAWGFNNHYKWVELPAWLTLPAEEVPVEPDYAVVIISTDQTINSIGNSAFDDFNPTWTVSAIVASGAEVTINEEIITFKFNVTDDFSSIVLYAPDGTNTSLEYDGLENGFIYDFSDFTVVAGEALVPVVTPIA